MIKRKAARTVQKKKNQTNHITIAAQSNAVLIRNEVGYYDHRFFKDLRPVKQTSNSPIKKLPTQSGASVMLVESEFDDLASQYGGVDATIRSYAEGLTSLHLVPFRDFMSIHDIHLKVFMLKFDYDNALPNKMQS